MGLITKIWAVVKLLKAGTYDKVADAILPLVLENKLVAPFLAKNKTVIGFILLAAYSVLQYAQVSFPEQAWIEPAILILGLILTALGIAHRGVKDRAI
jgi:hypothetical protein